MGLAVVALWLLQMDYFGVRPWRAVWAVVPGAKAIRYTFRSQLVANLFVSLIVAQTLAGLARHRIAVVVLCAVLIVEQVNLVWPATMSRKAALAWIDAAPAPPAGCRAFYLVPGAGPPERSGPQHQDDAMLFAQLRGIPTLNGYSSWFPDGWALDEPARPGVRRRGARLGGEEPHRWRGLRARAADGAMGRGVAMNTVIPGRAEARTRNPAADWFGTRKTHCHRPA